MKAEKRQLWDNQKGIGDPEKIISVHLQKLDTVNETQISGKKVKADLEYIFQGLSENGNLWDITIF